MTADAAHGDGNSNHDDTPRVPLYTKPIQRQKWGDTQSLPHTNWGDHFFDLFYVAGAYNLGNLLRFEPSPRGLLYFVGCFWPLSMVWNLKLYYDARFDVRDDLWHRLMQMAKLVALGTAVLHIRPVNILSAPEKNTDMFIFCISLAGCFLIAIIRFIEIQFGVHGQHVAKVATRRDLVWASATFILLCAAAAVAGLSYNPDNDYHSSDVEDDHHDSDTDEDGHRTLADIDYPESAYEKTDQNDWPVVICIVGSFLWTVGFIVHTLFFVTSEHHKSVSVPINISFIIHRHGDWTMLMLGESILSILIVESTNSSGYYKTFFSGIISVTLMQYLHFRSQPHSADHHAMRRSRAAGLAYGQLMLIYSASLIILGASYKMLLYEFSYDSSAEHRMLLPISKRWLAGGGGADSPLRFEASDRAQRTAYFFCSSLAVAWFCLDILLLTHRGLSVNSERCRCKESGGFRWLGVLLVLSRIGLLAFIATLSLYVTEPKTLGFIGLAGIVSQVVLRIVSASFFGPEISSDSDEDDSIKRWPNITVPQVDNSD